MNSRSAAFPHSGAREAEGCFVERIGELSFPPSGDEGEAAAADPVRAEVSAVQCEDLLDAFPFCYVYQRRICQIDREVAVFSDQRPQSEDIGLLDWQNPQVTAFAHLEQSILRLRREP